MDQEQKAPYRLVEHGGAYAELLRTAFNQVCDQTDWKASVDCMVPWNAANIYMDAISFMTGTVAECERVKRDGMYFARLKAIGYRAGPCN